MRNHLQWINDLAGLMLVVFSFSLGLIPEGISKEPVQNDLITKICLANFKAAMALAKKTPPAGMDTFTCACFLEKVTNGASIDDAQHSCKELAAKRFDL